MPRSKEGKTREKIDSGGLENAVNDVLKGHLKVNEAARRYGFNSTNNLIAKPRYQTNGLLLNLLESFGYVVSRNAILA
ncbi:hypothetical protein J6590_072914 [Homalodisca vitripennis]|nr:hypothetical protein J6590_072914 [Homalodisca vitripennis]